MQTPSRRTPPQRPLAASIAALLTAACTLAPLESETPRPTATPLATPTATASATPAPSPSATAGPDLTAIPNFVASEVVVTTIDGLRVRQGPGTDRSVITGLLPFNFELEVVMGPIVVDDIGWYQVVDADDDEPDFEEGWIAAGYEPDALLRTTGRFVEGSRFLASLAHEGDAEFGPVEIPHERHVIRWAAVDPERTGCQFALMLAAGGGAPVPAVRSPVTDAVIVGTLQSSYFASQPDLRGQVFITAETDCAWTLVVAREQDPSETPAP